MRTTDLSGLLIVWFPCPVAISLCLCIFSTPTSFQDSAQTLSCAHAPYQLQNPTFSPNAQCFGDIVRFNAQALGDIAGFNASALGDIVRFNAHIVGWSFGVDQGAQAQLNVRAAS